MARKDAEKEHISEEEIRRRVDERLRKLEDRDFHDRVRRMAAENERLRQRSEKGYRYNRLSSSGAGRTRCPECDGSGTVQCHVCDGRGDFLNRNGRIVTCPRCHGKRRVRCANYGCKNGYIQ